MSIFILLLAFGLASSCAPPNNRTEQPPRPTVMNVTTREYDFHLQQAGKVIPSGRVVFLVQNKGRLRHQLTLIVVPDDMPGTVAEEARSSQTAQIFENVFSLAARPPGRRGVFAVDLDPGRYAMVCLVEDSPGQLHAQKGMATEFRVA